MYQLIFQGQFTDELTEEEQHDVLVHSFKLSVAEIEAFKSGYSICLVSGLTEAEGKYFQLLFVMSGAILHLVEEQELPPTEQLFVIQNAMASREI